MTDPDPFGKVLAGLGCMFLGVCMVFYDGYTRPPFDFDVGMITFLGIVIGFFGYILFTERF